MSFELHNSSIKALLMAKNMQVSVWFGSFGRGLKREEKCKYISKGLFTENGYVFSIYHHI
jgi:hypothetical protein